MKTILHIVGNRPQFVKLAMLHKELSTVPEFSQKIIHTGQHWSADMSEIFFSELKIPPIDVQLQAIDSVSADEFIGQTSTLLQKYFQSQENSIAFVYGDTNTTLAAALAARRTDTPLFHFEAGIRTADPSMPEEINRILTDRIADTNYCCTKRNYATMFSEGYTSAIKSRVILSGDLMYDAFLKTSFIDSCNITSEKNYVLTTIHRAANILSKSNLRNIIEELNAIHKKIPVIMPLHPHTRKRMQEFGLQPDFTLLNPLGYVAMKSLLLNSSFVITDSGGLSREAFFSKKKSLIIMENPFWPEIIDTGCGINISPNESLEKALDKLSELNSDFLNPIFGDGNAAKLIKEDLLSAVN